MTNEEVTTTPPKATSTAAKKIATKSKAKPQTKVKDVAKKSVKPKVVKPAKVKKPKIVRESFAIPKLEHAAIATLKQRANQHELAMKKGELIRAGIKALSDMNDAAFLKAVRAIVEPKPETVQAK